MTTQRLTLPELVEGQAVPETTVNEQVRRIEAMASVAIVKDRDLTAPPGSCADGDSYIIAGSPTGAWAGRPNQIATAVGTNAANGWYFVVPIEGTFAYIQDENIFAKFDGASTWDDLAATAPQIRAGTLDNVFLTPLGLFAASAPAVLTSSASITPDGDNGFNFTLTLAHDATLQNPTNFDVGRSGIIEITQDGTGNQTLAYGSDWKFPGGAPVLSTAAGAIDVLAYIVIASGRILATLTKAYSS